MKLATIKDGSRDGQLAVVARDLKTAHLADAIAPTLQAALDDWAFIAPQLDQLYRQLNAGQVRRAFDFDPTLCMAPLPRAFQWVSGSSYFPTDGAADDEPLLTQGSSDALRGPCDDIMLAHEEWGIDFGAGVAAIVDDVAMGATPDAAYGWIRLLMLTNDIALRNLMPEGQGGACSVLQAKPGASCSPVAVTPDELGEDWHGGKVHLPLLSIWNAYQVGQANAGVDMAFNFPQLIAHLCKSRHVRAGSIVAVGPVSNRQGRKGKSPGYSCIAEQRSRELDIDGVPSTPYMRFGDTIRIEMLDTQGKSIFGAIEQILKQAAH